MNRKEASQQMANDDLFFAPLFVGITGYALWTAEHWYLYLLVGPFFLLGIIWLSARIYHITHPEVFDQE